MSVAERFRNSDFYRVFNFKSKAAQVRSLLLINTPLGNIANALTSGALYTAFLAENGIDIVRVGIISFIPYITWVLSLFSPMILSRFKMRQKLLLLNDAVFYICVILATTVMPLFVEDPTHKTIWFAVLLFIGNLCNALIGSGCTSWAAQFIPKGKDLNTYTAYSNLLMMVSSNGTGILASVAATILGRSGYQMELLFWLRIFAFVLFFGGSVMLYLIPKDEPLEELPNKIKLTDVVTEPVRHRPFLLTAIIPICWNVICGMNSATYSYYLLETVKIPLWYQYIGAVASMVGGICLSGVFRRLADKTSPYWVVGCFLLIYFVMELMYIFVGPGTVPLYIFLTVLGGFMGVGFNLGYNSLFYLKIPQGANNDLYAVFWNMISYVAGFIGAAAGTWLLAVFEARGLTYIGGMGFYGSQIICMFKAAGMLLTLLYIMKVTPGLQKTLEK